MIWIEGRFENEVRMPTSIDRLWSRIASKDGLESLFPGVESITPFGESENTWRWTMRRVGAAGVYVRPQITARFEFDREKHRVTVIPIEGNPADNAKFEGFFELEPDGEEATRVRSSIDMGLRLPIPWFAAPLARRIAAAKIRRYSQAFTENVRTATTHAP